MKKLVPTFLIYLIGFSNSFSQSGWININFNFGSQAVISDVHFINENTGWLCGTSGIVYKSIDGGLTWNQNVSSGSGYNNKILFINENTGWIIGHSYVKRTTDGGNTWQKLYLESIPSDIKFIDSMTGWISAKGIYRTTNGGENWNRYFVPAAEHFNIWSISFPTHDIGFCSGSYITKFGEESFIVGKTNNGGINWQIIREESGTSRLYQDIQFLNVNTGYLCRLPPIKTIDGGVTWKEVMDLSGYYLTMFFVSPDKGWFSSTNSTVFTEDGGTSWRIQPLPSQANLQDIFFINDLVGWTVGGDNYTAPKIFKTTTGGLTFTSQISSEIPGSYILKQNYPNPFNPKSIISYKVPSTEGGQLPNVKLIIYDNIGSEIRTLVNEKQNAGDYSVEWDAANFPSGVYFYQLTSEGFTQTRSMVLIK